MTATDWLLSKQPRLTSRSSCTPSAVMNREMLSPLEMRQVKSTS